MLGGDDVKDDLGCKAVFTEEGSPACQTAAGGVRDTMSRASGKAGEAQDAGAAWNAVQNSMTLPDCSSFW